MKPQELRIGNWVKYGPRLENKEIGDYEMIMLIDGGQNADPIPLTPEWLEKFGFEYRNEYRGNGYIFDLPNSKYSCCWFEDKGFRLLNLSYTWMPYVHQLQNLYFALTGEELIIK